ncbi:MAG: hypothetical protein KJ070_08970 [Verrucomicrobia bacterium]|nr:hypothetical protein [Verrucomicrobiota bacterium]
MKNQIVLKSFDELSRVAASNGAPGQAITFHAKPLMNGPSSAHPAPTSPGWSRQASGATGAASRIWRGCPAEAEGWSG